MIKHDFKAALDALKQLSWGYFCPTPSQKRGDGYHSGEKANVTASCIAALELAIIVEKNGEWDEGCFYYNQKSDSELGYILQQAKGANND